LSTDLFKTRFVDCWVVYGSTGEYSDRSEWAIAVFLDEAKARELVAEMDVKRDEIGIDIQDDYGDRDAAKLKRFNDHFGFEVVSHIQYTGVSFHMGKTIFGG
jgi:hypothetical protein